MAANKDDDLVQIVGWAPPHVVVVPAGPCEGDEINVLHGRATDLRRLLPATDEEAVIVYSQQWPLRHEDGQLRRTTALGAEVVAQFDDGAWPTTVGSVSAVAGRPFVEVEHLASVKLPVDERLLDPKVRDVIAAWSSRRSCEVDGCRILLSPGCRVCDGHLPDWRQGLLNQIEALNRRLEEHNQSEADMYVARVVKRAVEESKGSASSSLYSRASCVECGGRRYRHQITPGYPLGLGTVYTAVCDGCGRYYSGKRSGRRGDNMDPNVRKEVNGIIRRGWPIRAIGDSKLRVTDASPHWPELRTGRRLRTDKGNRQQRSKREVAAAAKSLREAQLRATQPQDKGREVDETEAVCADCCWPFGPRHRYKGGPSCEVLAAATKLSNGEWVRLPTSGVGLRKLIEHWPSQYYGPITFGHSSQYGLGINVGRAFRPIIEEETAAVTLARVQLLAVRTGISLDAALAEALGDVDP